MAKDFEDMPEIMTVSQVAQFVGVCLRTARKWTLEVNNPLPSFKIGNTRRVRKSTLITWIESREK